MNLSASIKALFLNRGLTQKKVVRDFTAVIGSQLAMRPVQFLKEFVVTKFLGPADYGILKSIELIHMLNKYGSLGFKPAAAREIGNAIGKGELEKADSVRNTAYSAEIILAFTLFFAGLLASLFFEGPTAILVILASAGLLAAKLRGILNTEAGVQKNFVLISKVTFVTSLAASVIIIITVPFLKIYAVILMNFLTGVFAIAFYLKTLRFNYSFKIQKDELKRILGISIPLLAGTLSQGSFRYAERILVLGFLGKIALGFYGFAFMIVNQFTVLFKAAIKVRTQDIYEALGRQEFRRVHKMVVRETSLLLGAAAIIMIATWHLIDLLIPLLLPRWQEGIFAAQLGLLVIPFEIGHNYATVVLQSSVVNKQKVIPVIQIFASVLLVAGAYTLKYFGLMDLSKFIFFNAFCYFFYSASIIVTYRIYFYNVYLK